MNGSRVFWNGRQALPADRQLISSVREEIVAAAQPVTRSSVAAALRAGRGLLAAGGAVGLADRIYAELGGLGPLQSLLGDPEVTDIHVNSPQEVWADRGSRLERVPLSFEDEGQLRALAVRLLAKAGKSLDESTPCLDARLPGGLRVNAVLPPISPPGTVLSIRIQRSRPVEVAEFLGVEAEAEAGASDPRVRTEVADLTRQIIASRCNFLISGATGSGKTTLLGALLGLCEQEERLVLIEDTAELAPVHPHIVRLESRPPNPEGRGALGLERLIFEAFRMNPGRLIVGECRGAEVRELFTALNTGHSGAGPSMRTVPRTYRPGWRRWEPWQGGMTVPWPLRRSVPLTFCSICSAAVLGGSYDRSLCSIAPVRSCTLAQRWFVSRWVGHEARPGPS